MKKLILLFLLVFPINLLAETLFVGDTLRVGIRSEPSKSVPSISVIKTGASVEVLERKNIYLKVRTQSGVEGWVKSAYLTRKTPANKKLLVANDKIKTLERELIALQKSSGETSSKTQQKLQTTIQQLQSEKNSILKELNELKTNPIAPSSNNEAKTKLAGFDLKSINKDLMYIILGAIIAILVLGFMFGVSWYKQQVTKRLGGLSI